MTVSHHYPGINGLTVWDLENGMWRLYSRAAQVIEDQAKKGRG